SRKIVLPAGRPGGAASRLRPSRFLAERTLLLLERGSHVLVALRSSGTARAEASLPHVPGRDASLRIAMPAGASASLASGPVHRGAVGRGSRVRSARNGTGRRG